MDDKSRDEAIGVCPGSRVRRVGRVMTRSIERGEAWVPDRRKLRRHGQGGDVPADETLDAEGLQLECLKKHAVRGGRWRFDEDTV